MWGIDAFFLAELFIVAKNKDRLSWSKIKYTNILHFGRTKHENVSRSVKMRNFAANVSCSDKLEAISQPKSQVSA